MPRQTHTRTPFPPVSMLIPTLLALADPWWLSLGAPQFKGFEIRLGRMYVHVCFSASFILIYVLMRRGSAQEFGKSVSFIVVVTAHSVYAPRPLPLAPPVLLDC